MLILLVLSLFLFVFFSTTYLYKKIVSYIIYIGLIFFLTHFYKILIKMQIKRIKITIKIILSLLMIKFDYFNGARMEIILLVYNSFISLSLSLFLLCSLSFHLLFFLLGVLFKDWILERSSRIFIEIVIKQKWRMKEVN